MHDHVNIDYELLITQIQKNKLVNWWTLYLFILKSEFNKSELTESNYLKLDPGLVYFNKIIEVLCNLCPPIEKIKNNKTVDVTINCNIIRNRKMKMVFHNYN